MCINVAYNAVSKFLSTFVSLRTIKALRVQNNRKPWIDTDSLKTIEMRYDLKEEKTVF